METKRRKRNRGSHKAHCINSNSAYASYPLTPTLAHYKKQSKMLTSKEIKQYVINIGAEKCGIANVERFSEAPEGFRPSDIYKESQSVIVFLKQMPTEIVLASNPIPYTHAAYLMYSDLDRIGLAICGFLQKNMQHGIPIPADVPYLHWEEKNKRGHGIISLRHSAYLAGLGILGRNTLLINEDLGNMVYIGAVLTNAKIDPDPLVEDFKCPPKCNICLDICPQKALNGITVNQKLCRQVSFYENERGFNIYDCNRCRRSCIFRTGKRKKRDV
ncbi:MAG: epoxyqueuosine reductase [Deltaproteobacteria bacterium]|nr:epoxyqueuosine reductase [Deltaproteobacteria bacterium]